ncbi:single-stranded-DNA-specific exonuclease RecJ [Candidatus Saccharibacteria bacterium]|nr:single-stranded-DNA-specific exonuclease RecJ [Candidatus Saccharibacteria bacterium]
MNKLFEQLLKTRHITPGFLNPKYEDLTDPYLLKDMEKAVKRIKKAIKNNENVLIYGDYDVDGVTSSTVMEEALTLAGMNPENISIMLPDRFADGYGMSPKLIERAKEKGVKLVITVDCGSRNHAIVDELNLLKIDTIITDHHECEDTLPEAIAVINPKRKDTSAPESLKNLAGVGVAFKVASALKEQKLIPDGQEKWLLDLVLLGTICDSMPLTEENRILGYYGIKVLQKTRRKGLVELSKIARVKTINSESIGFQLGPRLNAAGRLETADIALNLLRAKSSPEAAQLAAKLEDLNSKRRTEQLAATKEIDGHGVSDDPVIVEVGKWHEGILGIVAGRLVETYKKPAFVLTEIENNTLKGSGRSFGDFSLADALANLKDTIIGGGGHAGAAGVRLEQGKLYEFREKINAYYNSLKLGDQSKYLQKSYDIATDSLEDFNTELIEDLKSMEPFGAGNEEPIFCITRPTITNVSRMGADQNHLRLDIADKNGNRLKLIAFFAPEKWLNLDPEGEYNILIRLTENEFQSVRSVEGRIIDIL